MTSKANRKDNPRRAAKRLAQQLRSWIASSLVGRVCSCCGGPASGCDCGATALDPAEFQAEGEEA